MQAGTRLAVNKIPEKPPDGTWRQAHRPAVPPPRPPSHRSWGHPPAPFDHTPGRLVRSDPVAQQPIPKLPRHRLAEYQWCEPEPNPQRAADLQGPIQPALRKDAAGWNPTPTGMRCGIAGHPPPARIYSFLSSSHIRAPLSSETCAIKGDERHRCLV